MRLPATPARREQAARGLARMEELIDASGAEGFRPELWRARERWSADAAEAARCRAARIEAYRRIGATGHLRRLGATMG
jgi:transposase InsO family protein